MLDLSQLGYMETDIIEMPVIVVDGKAKLPTPAMKELPESLLKEMAKMMGGHLVWAKLRVNFSNLEVPLCVEKKCTRIAHYADHKCETHTTMATHKEVKL